MDFRNQMHVVIKHIIGWNEDSGQPMDNGGVFGTVEAFTEAVEEQGRKTLHAHFLLWIRDLRDDIRRLVFERNENVRHRLAAKITKRIDEIVSTQLHGNFSATIVDCVDSNCNGELERRPDDQHYRNMRHRHGSKLAEGVVASCKECGKCVNSEQAASQVLNEAFACKLSCGAPSYVLDTIRALDDVLMTHVYDIQNLDDQERRQRFFLINALYNLHRCVHSKGCFKNGEECRFDLPGKIVANTILKFTEEPVTFFDVLGKKLHARPFTPEVERMALDSFMNHYSPHTSLALGCNSNVAIGNILQLFYSTTYASKGTQDDDRKTYDKIVKSVKRRMQEVNEDDPFKEGLARMYCSIIIRNQGSIVSAPMAHYLVTNDSRFNMSHSFCALPLRSFLKYLQGFNPPCFLRRVKDKYLSSSLIFDYIYRSSELETLTLWEFTSLYETKIVTRKNSPSAFKFQTQHPSYFGNTEGNATLASFRRDKQHIPLVSFYGIPDLQNVGDYMNHSSTHVSQTIARNNYAMSILCLFHAYRSPRDLQINGSYMTKLQHVRRHCPGIFTKCLTNNVTVDDVIFNLQQCHNATKVKRVPDDLANRTHPFQCNGRQNEEENDDDENESTLNHVLEELDEHGLMDFDELNIGNAGYNIKNKEDPRRSCKNLNNGSNLNDVIDKTVFLNVMEEDDSEQQLDGHKRQTTTTKEIIELSHSFANNQLRRINDQDKIKVQHKADGTRESLRKWSGAEGYNLDLKQTLAYKSIISTFILTYVDEARDVHCAADMPNTRVQLRHLTEELSQMRNIRGYGSERLQRQLLMFMTGPGGSGKSKVIDAVVHYAREYVQNLGLNFSKHTIVITALSGVAAVNVNGETTHRACRTNYNLDNIDNEMISEWNDTRLLIIDEISFADMDFMEQLHEKLTCLKQKPNNLYGNMNIIFCGDFRQLPPINKKGKCLYDFPNHALWENAINVLVELEGNHRFKDDPEWGDILNRFRNGTPLPQDFLAINARLVHAGTELPDNISIACYKNETRKSIHAGLFNEHLRINNFPQDVSTKPPEHTVIIKSDLQWSESKKHVSDELKRVIYSHCGDSDCRSGKSKKKKNGQLMGGSELNDPFLCLYHGCYVMINSNIDVKNGIASGSVCEFVGIIMRQGAQPRAEKVNGRFVYTVNATDVETIRLKTTKGKFVNLESEKKATIIKVPYMSPDNRVSEKINMQQFPIILTTATTGHKLQGETKDALLVYEWNYGSNWPYVVLSRVKQLNGLYLMKELNPNKTYDVEDSLIRHMATLRNSHNIVNLGEDDDE